MEGGHGREISFRPKRFGRDDLGPLHPVVRVATTRGPSNQVGEKPSRLECTLKDVSQSGIAFEWPLDVPIQVGTLIQELAIRFDHHEVYRGGGIVRSIRDAVDHRIVGASFTDSLLNVDEVLIMRDVKSWNAGGFGAAAAVSERVWQVDGHDQFKALTGELRLYLEDAARALGELERSLPAELVHDSAISPGRQALIDAVRLRFVPDIVRYSDAINAAFGRAGPDAVPALKEYAIRQVHEFLMLCPWMRRALEKPLGYPGDYEVMRYVYERSFDGSNLFAKALSLAFLETHAARAVRSRKDLIKHHLSARIDRHSSCAAPLRIVSIASGSGQEIYELLSERTCLPGRIEFVLFDQDRGALSYAFSRLGPLADSKWSGLVRIDYRHDSIKRLLLDKEICVDLAPSDVLVCSGLFDYLRPSTAISLARKFYRCLNEGGAAYIGNMVPTNPSRWFMELHLDWSLLYRTRREMIGFAKAAAPDAQIEIVEESTGINPFVVMTRR